MISMGQGEPAMMPVRRLPRSNIGNIGWVSSAMNIVGTPYSAVHRSFWTEARTRSGSKLSTITAVAPWVTMAMTPSTSPKQWKSGHRQADSLRRGELLPLPDVEAVVQDVVVGEHHALGEPGGPRGVLHVDHFVAAQGARGAFKGILRSRGCPAEGAPACCTSPGASRGP